ncbi:monovalent cation/H(+) antiporter subunit G [Butyricicoccus faecihominis]|uniref:monovalent cation/H(+) antiporter subunit G n=1 Tax=Butyricicoccus faecihominis TaxID=1712515 RepID=UPI00247A1643|nr:monovalent cation/H(+) antiporter subunit G [Butyricicoccus faecihominis]MCQ5129384.1 monovalent cation/H(+) antiporter subunit G [Butyricicoccus faecihominis]
MLLLGNLVLALGLVIIACGMIGLIRAKGFYRRLLAGALVDTAGLLVLLLGVLLRQGLTPFSLKIALLMGAVLLTAPLITHKLGRSAYLSGHREEVQEHVE